MIYPTRRGVWLMALGAPLFLTLAVVAPGLWLLSPLWIIAVLGLMLADVWTAAPRAGVRFALEAPPTLAVVAAAEPAWLEIRFEGRAPREVEACLEVDARLSVSPARRRGALQAGTARLAFELTALRRGEGRIDRAWARWTGPLGLLHLQRIEPLDRATAVTPDIAGVKQKALRLFARDALFGQKSQLDRGDGTDFHALREFQPGMDRRTIDWKQSARHGALLAKETREERNHPVVLALDCGRLMGEPVAGAPKLDRALNAALLLGYVALRLGDRVGLFAFDARPRIMSRPLTGARAFPMLAHLAGRIDYSAEETNFTFGLSTLAGDLDRRALVVVFTDFADATSAQLMIESLARIAARHQVLFVVFEDEELEALARAAPETPADVSRAVVAAALLQEREVVITRLRRLGVEVVEARPDRIGPQLLNRYADLSRRGRL